MQAHRADRKVLILALGLAVFCRAGLSAQGGETLVVADMEGPTTYRAFPFEKPNSPKAELSPATAAAGRRSLRFEFDADGTERASLALPFTNALERFNVLAFEFYCERDNGGQLSVTVHPQGDADPEQPAAAYTATLRLSEGRDGWMTVRLIKDRTLQPGGVPGRPTRWEAPRAISFGLSSSMKGKVVFYLDQVRFEQLAADAGSNMLLNSSFEQATNPDSPDGWRRDFDQPPFGPEAWRLDRTTAWHGTNSLRLGAEGKTAYAWCRFVNLSLEREHVFSAYLRGDGTPTRARLEVNGLDKPSGAEFEVGPGWQRVHWSGKAFRARTLATITLVSGGPLWIDAVQLEEGREPSPFNAPDAVEVEDRSAAGAAALPEPLNRPPRQVVARRAVATPVIDGRLADACWQAAEPLSEFVGLEANAPAALQTTARVTYDADHLYLAVFAADPDMAATRERLAGASQPWSDDSAEVFLDFNGDRRSYYQFIFNANGDVWFARFASPRQRTNWETEWKAAGALEEGGWSVEIAIPFHALDLATEPPAGERIGLNICRNVKGRDGRPDTNSSWSFSHGAFHNPRAFGELNGFDPAVLAPYRWDVETLTWARGVVRASLRNRTGAAAALRLQFEAVSAEGTNTTAAVTHTLAAGEAIDLTAPLALDRDGFYKVRLLGRDPAGGALRLASQPAAVKVSGANLFDLVGPEFDFYTDDPVARARCFIEAGPALCAALRLQWRLTDAAGATPRHGELTPSPGANHWAIDLKGLPAGDYRLDATLRRDGAALAEAVAPLRKLPPAAQEVRINRWGRFVVANGEPILAFGWFDSSIARRDPLPVFDAVVAEMAANGCTVFPAYTGLATNLAESLGAYLDTAWKHRVRLWVHLSGMFTWNDPRSARHGNRFRSREAAEDALTRVITQHKDHPAVLGWLTYDEPGNRPDLFDAAATLASYRLVKRLDPHRPCFFSHLNHLGDARIYGPATDIALIPFLERGGRYDHLFEELWRAGLPLFVNAPCYGAAGGSMREPTPAEQRLRTYKGIILGARGVQYYTFRPASEVVWKSMGTLAAELQALAPALLAPDERLLLEVAPASGDLFAKLVRDGTAVYLLAVNTAPQPVDALFHLGPLRTAGTAAPLFGAPAARFDAAGGRLQVTLPGSSTAVYRLATTEEDPGLE